MNELRLIDTFSGIGGFSYAAEKLVGGFKTVAFVECEPYCQKVLKKHWPEVPIYDDIKTYKPEPLSGDVLVAGFPCVDISFAGKQAGITKETRSGLFYEIIRLIRLVSPRFIVLENVAAIINNGLGIVLGELASAGYSTEWCCIRASDLGGSHKRDRFFSVSYVANTNSERLQGLRPEYELQEGCTERKACWSPSRITLEPNWRRYISKPTVPRGDDVIPNWVHRSKRIKALGNSLLPAVAAIPLQRVKDLSML
tara:strand:- start:2834 stop:3595 length:762 start_codon:yes stop_codon:yes gene_type:complete